jgi:hypothetical protein
MISIGQWLKPRWRLLLVLLTPLVLLPLPILGNSPVCYCFKVFFWIIFFLASKMWIYCTNSNCILGLWSNTITSNFSITTCTFSDGKKNLDVYLGNSIERFFRLVFYLQKLLLHTISKILLHYFSAVCLLLLQLNLLTFIDELLYLF